MVPRTTYGDKCCPSQARGGKGVWYSKRGAYCRANMLSHSCESNVLFTESAEFQRAKGTYARKEELLQHLVDQQRARLEQISVELQRIKAEVRVLPAF